MALPSLSIDRARGPLILVAPASVTRTDEHGLAAALAPHFTAFAYDRRGRGDSGDTAPYAVGSARSILDALIDEAGGSPYVFGRSSGAVLALEAVRACCLARSRSWHCTSPVSGLTTAGLRHRRISWRASPGCWRRPPRRCRRALPDGSGYPPWR